MTYDTNEMIPTLSKVRKLERDKQKEKMHKEAKELLLKALSYYNVHYPKSTHDNIWKKSKIKIEIGKNTLEDELESLNEEELHNLFEILSYFHDERQMNKVSEHNLRTRILAMVKKLIPGGDIQERLYDLHEKQKQTDKEIKELEDILIKKREAFTKRIEKDKKWKPVYLTCEICGKVCRSAAGLKSHSRKHPEIEDDEESL